MIVLQFTEHKKVKNYTYLLQDIRVRLFRRFLRECLSKQKDIEPEFAKVLNDNLWDLI